MDIDKHLTKELAPVSSHPPDCKEQSANATKCFIDLNGTEWHTHIDGYPLARLPHTNAYVPARNYMVERAIDNLAEALNWARELK